MSASAFPKALERGTGRSLKVEIVACGKQKEGLLSNLNAFSVAETFIRMVWRYVEPVLELGMGTNKRRIRGSNLGI